MPKTQVRSPKTSAMRGAGWAKLPVRMTARATRFTLEVEGNEKPCFVGDSVTRVMAPAD
jgi:hypothetical protein